MTEAKPTYAFQRYRKDTNAAFVARVMELWDAKKDTCDIAQALFEPEHVIAKALMIGREKRRQK